MSAPRKACAVCGKDLGPGPFAESAPYACSLRCFYVLHPDRRADAAAAPSPELPAATTSAEDGR